MNKRYSENRLILISVAFLTSNVSNFRILASSLGRSWAQRPIINFLQFFNSPLITSGNFLRPDPSQARRHPQPSPDHVIISSSFLHLMITRPQTGRPEVSQRLRSHDDKGNTQTIITFARLIFTLSKPLFLNHGLFGRID